MRPYILTFKNTANIRLLHSLGVYDVHVPKNFPYIVFCKLDEVLKNAVESVEDIVAIEEDLADDYEDVGGTSEQYESYAIDLLEVKKYHDQGFKGQGIKIAVFDSGIQKHEDLVIKGGINAYDQSKPYDANIYNSHGTMVAGVLAAKDNEKGTLGVAPECDLYAVKLDDNAGSKNGSRWSEQIIGLDWAMSNGIDIINCSFSGLTDSTARYNAFKDAHESGIIICGSAGNMQNRVDDDRSTLGFPCSYPFVVTTANVRPDKSRNSSSCMGAFINFSSGGTSITSTTTDSDNAVSNKYRTGTGTSYASPTIAGIIALHKQMFPSLSNDEILNVMYENSEKLGESWEYGAGIPKFPTKQFKNIQLKHRGDGASKDISMKSKYGNDKTAQMKARM